jgi:N-terminal 7TM region of histidine kinase
LTRAYIYTPDLWLSLAGAVLMAAIGLHCWRRRDVPGALPLLAVSLVAVLWLLGIALEAAAAPGTKIAWLKFQALWRAPAVIAGLCFVLEYAYPGRWLTRRNLIREGVRASLANCPALEVIVLDQPLDKPSEQLRLLCPAAVVLDLGAVQPDSLLLQRTDLLQVNQEASEETECHAYRSTKSLPTSAWPTIAATWSA